MSESRPATRQGQRHAVHVQIADRSLARGLEWHARWMYRQHWVHSGVIAKGPYDTAYPYDQEPAVWTIKDGKVVPADEP